jgi:hypothetical protein
MAALTIGEARRIFAADCLGAEELDAALVAGPRHATSRAERALADELPFDRDTLMRAADEGMMLVLRWNRAADGRALTVNTLAERFPGRTQATGTTPWFAAEPFAAEATCRPGWALVDKTPATETKNLSHAEQDAELSRRGESLGLRLRRRAAVEIVHDTLLYAAARGERLLESDWDWSSTMTLDGGAVTAGRFDEAGLRLLAYSKAVRFDSLGVCATVDLISSS